MDDLISRQAAILAIEEYADRLQMVNWEENPGVPYKAHTLNWAINTLRDLPSAEPERKKGKWIVRFVFEDCRYVKCNQCKVTQVLHNNTPLPNFCPNCGSKMDLEE